MVVPSSAKRIVVAHRVHDTVRARLSTIGEVIENSGDAPWDRDTMMAHCCDADAMMAFMTETVDAAFLDACPKLQHIAGALKGYNNLDVAACTERGVVITNVPDLLTAPTAELTVGLMIALAREFRPAEAHVRSGAFAGWRPRFYGGSLNGATVVVLGAGAVGRAVLRNLSGFDCKRFYVDKAQLPPEVETALGATRLDLHPALARADFLVLGLHLTPDTRHMVDAEFLSRLKPGAYLINPARGSLVDESAVVDALSKDRLGGYAADTFELEDWALHDRPRHIHPALLESDRTILTPHIGSAVARVREEIELSAATSIEAFLAGDLPDTVVNPEALTRTLRQEIVHC